MPCGWQPKGIWRGLAIFEKEKAADKKSRAMILPGENKNLSLRAYAQAWFANTLARDTGQSRARGIAYAATATRIRWV
jgi:hypothetical protein